MTIKIKRLEKTDLIKFIALIKLFENVFEMKDFSLPNSKHLQHLLNQASFSAFVALLDNQVVGGLTTYILDQYYSEKHLAYIYDLAVNNDLQRQGIGTKLIEEVKRFYSEKGFEEIFVQTEKVDDHAITFYRKTNALEEGVAHFYYTLN